MLELHLLRSKPDEIRQGLITRNHKSDRDLVGEAIKLDDQRKAIQTELDVILSQVNKRSGEIGDLYKNGQKEEANALRASVGAIKEEAKVLEEKSKEIRSALDSLLLEIPNLPHPTVPPGASDADNELVKDRSDPLPQLPDSAKPHWELGTDYGILDFALGVKITGAGFPVFRGKGAQLQRALINFFLSEAHQAGYEEIQTPLLVNADSARATGQLPDKEGQMYHVEKDNLYLIPTAEVPITNVLRNVTVDLETLPLKMTGYTPCFRREAGSYGADVKGLNRVHQFDKVEIVQVVHPTHSYTVLDEMVAHVETLLQKLELPYRILRLCGGDLGFTSALTYDFEVYSAAQKKWLEVSSVSNFETFQSNRLNLKFKENGKKPVLAHTLNGSALALARIVASILENNQTSTGIKIPKVLQQYTGFAEIN